jgi:hypothetical protein
VIVSGELTISWSENGTEVRQTISVPRLEVNEHTPGTSKYRFSAYCEEWNTLDSADSPTQAIGGVLGRIGQGLKIGNMEV